MPFQTLSTKQSEVAEFDITRLLYYLKLVKCVYLLSVQI